MTVEGIKGFPKRVDGGGIGCLWGEVQLLYHSESKDIKWARLEDPGEQYLKARQGRPCAGILASHCIPTPTLGGPYPLSPSVQVKDWKLKSSVTSVPPARGRAGLGTGSLRPQSRGLPRGSLSPYAAQQRQLEPGVSRSNRRSSRPPGPACFHRPPWPPAFLACK